MHTTSTTFHRIFFSNITNPDLLSDVADILGMESTEDPNVWDLVQSEGESTIICDALSDTFPERLLPVGCRDAYDMVFEELVAAFRELAAKEAVTPISNLFDVTRYSTDVNDTDIDCDELFDLLSVLGSTHFVVDGIFTQWAMHSNKDQFGAHAGGSQITTKYFCSPCRIAPEQAETIIRTLVKHRPIEMGDYYVKNFIAPMMDSIRDPGLREATSNAFRRWFN
ncbi:hypothetical protein D9M68_19250 [compost metagenome]